MSGPELADRLRRRFSKERMVLVAVTDLRRDAPEARTPVFDRHLLKPISPETVATLLNGLASDA